MTQREHDPIRDAKSLLEGMKTTVAALDNALSGKGTDAGSLLAAGKVFEIDGELGAAELAYRAALEVDPTDVETAGRLIMTLVKLGKADDALTIARQLAERAPAATFPSLLQGHRISVEAVVGEVLVVLGQHEAAATAFEGALGQTEGDPLASVRLGALLLASGRPADASAVLEGSAALGPAAKGLAATARLAGKEGFAGLQVEPVAIMPLAESQSGVGV